MLPHGRDELNQITLQLKDDLGVKMWHQKLSSIGGITSKKMFGGHGIFHDNKMFGIVDSKGRTYLKTDEATAPLYLDKGSVRHGKMPYHSIPDEILNSTADLVTFVKQSIETANS